MGISTLETQYNFLSLAVNKIQKEFEEKALAYLKANLSALGYDFESHSDFLKFLLERLTSIQVDVDLYHVVLDYNEVTEDGILIGIISEKMNIEMSLGDIKITIG